MTVNELITRAQYLAGQNEVVGTAIDVNFFNFAYEIFQQVLMDLNNDARFAIQTDHIDYNRDGYLGEDGTIVYNAAMKYPLPENCSRVLRAFSGPVELRKVEYSTIIQTINYSGWNNRFAVNGKFVYVVLPSELQMTYVSRIKIPEVGEEIEIPDEYLSYLVYQTAYKLASALSLPSTGRCNAAAQESFNLILSTKQVNNGDVYQSIYTSINRFMPIGQGI